MNVQSFKKLAQLQGVLINLFEKNEYLYDFVAPTQWQNYCKARGRTTAGAVCLQYFSKALIETLFFFAIRCFSLELKMIYRIITNTNCICTGMADMAKRQDVPPQDFAMAIANRVAKAED